MLVLPWLGLAVVGLLLVFGRVHVPQGTPQTSPAVALYIDGLDFLNQQDLRVTARVTAPPVGVTGCSATVVVSLAIEPSRAFWRHYGRLLRRRRFVLIVGGGVGRGIYPTEDSTLPWRPADGAGLHLAAVGWDLPSYGFGPGRPWQPFFQASWAHRRGFGRCTVQLPSVTGDAAYNSWNLGRLLLHPPPRCSAAAGRGFCSGGGIAGLHPPASVAYSVLQPTADAAWKLDEGETTPAPTQTRPAVWACRAAAPPDVPADCNAQATLVAPWLATARDLLLLVIGTLVGIVFDLARKPPARRSQTAARASR